MIYFYPHSYLRDRQLDTIRNWPRNEVINYDIAQNRVGAQVSRTKATSNKSSGSWKQVFPLLNIKPRPKKAPKDATIYLWGGLIATGPFIVDIDNPWSLVGYNLHAMPIYRFIIKKVLLSSRCLEIRCMSKACRKSLLQLFGETVFNKAKVHYPTFGIEITPSTPNQKQNFCRLLFIGSQFEIKGGVALLNAFRKAKNTNKNISLDIITHLPAHFSEIVQNIPDITVHSPDFSRQDIFKLMRDSDVLLHPSYMESFGMTILEAMANGLAIIANDIYAIPEMVIDGENGFLLSPPISKWAGELPNHHFMEKAEYIDAIRKLDNEEYVDQLASTIIKIANNPESTNKMKEKSVKRFQMMKASNG